MASLMWLPTRGECSRFWTLPKSQRSSGLVTLLTDRTTLAACKFCQGLSNNRKDCPETPVKHDHAEDTPTIKQSRANSAGRGRSSMEELLQGPWEKAKH